MNMTRLKVFFASHLQMKYVPFFLCIDRFRRGERKMVDIRGHVRASSQSFPLPEPTVVGQIILLFVERTPCFSIIVIERSTALRIRLFWSVSKYDKRPRKQLTIRRTTCSAFVESREGKIVISELSWIEWRCCAWTAARTIVYQQCSTDRSW